MECANCGETFEVRGKGFKRYPLVSKKRSPTSLKRVVGSDVTPSTSARQDKRFVCNKCDGLLKSASAGEKAKSELFTLTKPSSYVGAKRKQITEASPAKRMRFSPKAGAYSSTPIRPSSSKKGRFMQTGARYLCDYKYKAGFRWFIKKSAKAKKDFLSIASDTVRKEIRSLRNSSIALCEPVSVKSFENLKWTSVLEDVKSIAPAVYENLLCLLSKKKHSDSDAVSANLIPIMGTIVAMILYQQRPRKASLFQKMNAVQLWRSGCKRSIFADFQHIGISVGETAMRATLDTLVKGFDAQLRSWKIEMEKYFFPSKRQIEDVADIENDSSSTAESEYLESSSTTSASISDDDWEDLVELEDLDNTIKSSPANATINYSEQDVTKGFTLCWDNVGRHTKARHQTRNYGNKYMSWALAFAAKNRVSTVAFNNDDTIPATDVPMSTYFLSHSDMDGIRDKMVLQVKQIITTYVKCFEEIPVEQHIRHDFFEQSKMKSELFNVGVLNENPSTIAGVIKILEKLQAYVPTHEGKFVKLITWGDGLSCERHVDAQNARANAETPLDRLEGLEPSPQEFHKRMLLMQDTMDKLYNPKSASERGTLYQLRNFLNQRSVTRNVSDSFNYVSEFLTFVTECFVLLFALRKLSITSLNDEVEDADEQLLHSISRAIVDEVWHDHSIYEPASDSDTEGYEHCFCKEDLEDEDVPMMECSNNDCENGRWFHFQCVGLAEDNLPDGVWYCSRACTTATTHYKYCICKTYAKDAPMVECCNSSCKDRWFHALCVGLAPDKLPKEDEEWFCSACTHQSGPDDKLEYTKAVVWRGLSDRIRRQAVRENDGPSMIKFWKADMADFTNQNHHKYVILGHRLITAVNGWLPERLRQDLLWNRTVNLTGGAGKNLEIDLVNEYLNKEFKESIKHVGTVSDATLDRHGKLAGGVGEILDKIYTKLTDAPTTVPHSRKDANRLRDMVSVIKLLTPENLTEFVPNRAHKTFKNFAWLMKIKNVSKYVKKMKLLSQKIERRNHVIAN